MINLVKASAGSGKTFLLAKTYISLILESEQAYAYRNILAITFTNKATAEMKSRVVKELYILANEPDKSAYINEFVTKIGSISEVQRRADKVLKEILHDYSAFSISTIDSFFQRTLKAFAHELGQHTNYQLDLDKSNLINESVDRIMDSINENNRDLFEWIKDSALDYIAINERFKVDAGLYDMALSVLSDNFQQLIKYNDIDIQKKYSKESLSLLKTSLEKLASDYISDLKSCAKKIEEEFINLGISMGDTMRAFMEKSVRSIGKLKVGDKIELATFIKNAPDVNMWFPKKYHKYISLISTDLEQEVSSLLSLLENKLVYYNTAMIVRTQLFSLGVISEIYNEFNNLILEKNIISIDDSNDIINKIINNTDAPFIYEKLGVRYENFLLDEFQDTSLIQWENIKSLIRESVSNNRDNLIVGDIKQSIYRFRGGDWRLLDTVVSEEFPEYINEQSLKTNWRSTKRIIEFNNDIFDFLKKEFSHILPYGDQINKIYADVEQYYPQTKTTSEDLYGSVRIDFTSDILKEIHFAINKIIKEGASYGQIAILVRTKQMGANVADMLTKFKLPFISEDSLFVKSSPMVRNIVSLLSLVDNPDDSIYSYQASQLDVRVPLKYNSLIDLCEALIRDLSKEDLAKHLAYLQAFMDIVKDWTDRNGNDLHSFIKYWEGVEPKIPSPEVLNAITIITVHKSKGLEYDYVICPIKQQKLRVDEKIWAIPDEAEDFSSLFSDIAYLVPLTDLAYSSLFKSSFEYNSFLQGVDLLNMAYVAFTRASKTLHIISEQISESFKKAYSKGDVQYKYLHQLIFSYVHNRDKKINLESVDDGQDFLNFVEEYYIKDEEDFVRQSYIYGEMYPYANESDSSVSESSNKKEVDLSYSSYPIYNDDSEMLKKDRLSFTSDYDDFFAECAIGIESSHRLRGIVLHKILSYIIVPADLDKAVDRVLSTGIINEKQAVQAREYLLSAINSVESYEWFSESHEGVYNELSVFDEKGSVYRPDRVLIRNGRVVIVDYKFGEAKKSYHKQILNYVSLFKSMQYTDISAYLWYVDKLDNNVEKVLFA